MKKQDVIILCSGRAEILNEKIQPFLEQGYHAMGATTVATTFSQNRFSGNHHMQTTHNLEYSITLIKDLQENN